MSIKKSLLAVGLLAGAMTMLGTGCLSTEVNKVGGQAEVKVPTMVKLDVESKNELIEGTAKINALFGLITWGDTAAQAVGVDYGTGDDAGFLPLPDAGMIARNAALYKATTAANADIVVTPRYVLKVKDYFVFKQIECTVKGYPGFIKGAEIMPCPKLTK